MANYQRILVGLDVTKESEQVIAKAVEVTEENRAEICIVHALDLPVAGYADMMGGNMIAIEQSIREGVYPQLCELADKHDIPHSAVSIENGRSIDVIIEKAGQCNADLIVVGSHGRHGLQLMLGSTANGIIHHAKCDVLTVRIYD